MLNRHGESIQFTTKYYINYRFFMTVLYQVEEVFSIPSLLRIFIRNGVGVYQLLFLHLLKWLIGSSILVWGRLRAGGEGDKRGWDGWMASPTQWTWVWADSGRWWWTGKPGVLQSMGSQRVRHDWVTELNWTDSLSGSHMQLWELDHKESWAPKNWCFWTVVLEKTLESP